MTADLHTLALKVMKNDNQAFAQMKTVEEAEAIQAALLAYAGTLPVEEAHRVTAILPKLLLYKRMLGPFVAVPNGVIDDFEHVRVICKVGQGSESCRYLLMAQYGWKCAKLMRARTIIDERVAQGRFHAKGDNCEGR